MRALTPSEYLALSLIAKDVVGCAMYTTTARKNKKYTPEKRADVANYDLANGIINVSLQLACIKPIEKISEKLIDTKVIKKFFNKFDERLANSDNQAAIKLLKNKAGLTKGATAIVSMILCQYFIKRFISPYFSMPTSEKFNEWGLIRPKVYPGETYVRKKKSKNVDETNPVGQKADIKA